ncbi:MAG TPA: DUF2937 family protein [Parachlamydiaceae bacterium]|nr:DUF2937 family protein [Parachlamydiaceae bacterium]
MLKWIVNTLDKIAAIIGALIFSQAPMFMQQYKQQLAGHLNELEFQLDAIKQAATLSGKELEAFIQKFITNADLDFSRLGLIMQEMLVRYQKLLDSYNALNTTSAFRRPFTFLFNFLPDIASSTYQSFQFGIEFSFEGLIYALIGLLLGYGVFAGIKYAFKIVSSFIKP